MAHLTCYPNCWNSTWSPHHSCNLYPLLLLHPLWCLSFYGVAWHVFPLILFLHGVRYVRHSCITWVISNQIPNVNCLSLVQLELFIITCWWVFFCSISLQQLRWFLVLETYFLGHLNSLEISLIWICLVSKFLIWSRIWVFNYFSFTWIHVIAIRSHLSLPYYRIFEVKNGPKNKNVQQKSTL